MTNQRLRGAMLNAEMSVSALASAAGVDFKSVARWVSEDRVPYPVTRVKIARALGQRETYLWPSLMNVAGAADQNLAELERVWPTRSAVPSEMWHSLFGHATSQLDILVYAGGFLLETLDLVDVLRWKADAGTQVRVLIGDPRSEAVKIRSDEISLRWLPDRCQTTARYLDAVRREHGVSIRHHSTTLYASTFRLTTSCLSTPTRSVSGQLNRLRCRCVSRRGQASSTSMRRRSNESGIGLLRSISGCDQTGFCRSA